MVKQQNTQSSNAFQSSNDIAKREFLAKMRHDLRTCTGAIIGYSEMLMEILEDENELALIPKLDEVRFAGNKLTKVVNHIFDYDILDETENIDVSYYSKVLRNSSETDLADITNIIEVFKGTYRNPEIQNDLEQILIAANRFNKLTKTIENYSSSS